MRWSSVLALASASLDCTLDTWKIRCIGSAFVKDGQTCGQVQCADGRAAFPEAVACEDGELRTVDGGSLAGFLCAEDGAVDHDAVPLRAARRLRLRQLWDGPSGWRDARAWAGRYEAPCGLPTNLTFTVEVSGAGIEEVVLTRKDSTIPVSVGVLTQAANGTVAQLVAPHAGEFEVRARDGRGVWHHFRSTRFRIGSPWGCNEEKYDLEAVVLALHGAPTLGGVDRYLHLKRSIVGARVPVRVVLPIFIGDRKWTTSDDGACELDGRTCADPEHAECSPEYCELDRWRFVMQGLGASSPGNVTILGLVNLGPSMETQGLRSEEAIAADIQAYAALGVAGFYFAGHDGSGGLGLEALEQVLAMRARHVPPGAFVAMELREPVFHPPLLAHAHRPDLWVTAVAQAGKMGPWAPFAWYAEESPKIWGAALHGIAEPLAHGLGNLLDRGYGTAVLPPDAADSVGDVVRALTWKSGLQGGRRLGGYVDMTQLAYAQVEWGCDDTMDSCHPVCLLRHRVGAVRTAQEACAGKPQRCSCRCFDAPQWTCFNSSSAAPSQCTAMRSDKVRQVVGDLVCAASEPPKPCVGPEGPARRTPTPACSAASASAPAWAAYLRANQRPDLHLELEDISGERAAELVSAAGWPATLAFAAALLAASN